MALRLARAVAIAACTQVAADLSADPVCTVDSGRSFDVCKLIPFWHGRPVKVNKQMPWLKDIAGKMEDGVSVTLNGLELIDLVIPNCKAVASKNNVTVVVEGLGVDISASASGGYVGQVAAHLMLGDVEFNIRECKLVMTSKTSGFGPATAQLYHGAGLPNFNWAPASGTLGTDALAVDGMVPSGFVDGLEPVLTAAAIQGTAPVGRVDWCGLVQPFMGKTLPCDPPISLDKYINKGQPVEPDTSKIPLVDHIEISNFRIVDFVTAVCDVEGPPFLFNVTVKSQGPKAIIAMDVSVHACMKILGIKVCKTLHPKVTVTVQVPFAANVYVHEVLELDEKVYLAPFGFSVDLKMSSASPFSGLLLTEDDDCQTEEECDAKVMSYTQQAITSDVAAGAFGKDLKAAFETVLHQNHSAADGAKAYLLV